VSYLDSGDIGKVRPNLTQNGFFGGNKKIVQLVSEKTPVFLRQLCCFATKLNLGHFWVWKEEKEVKVKDF